MQAQSSRISTQLEETSILGNCNIDDFVSTESAIVGISRIVNQVSRVNSCGDEPNANYYSFLAGDCAGGGVREPRLVASNSALLPVPAAASSCCSQTSAVEMVTPTPSSLSVLPYQPKSLSSALPYQPNSCNRHYNRHQRPHRNTSMQHTCGRSTKTPFCGGGGGNGGSGGGGGVRGNTNNRERQRQRSVNTAFDNLKRHLPVYPETKKLSKSEILRLAIKYINILDGIVAFQRGESDEGCKPKESNEPNKHTVTLEKNAPCDDILLIEYDEDYDNEEDEFEDDYTNFELR